MRALWLLTSAFILPCIAFIHRLQCVMPYPAYKRDVGCPASTTQQLALDTAAHAARTAPPGDMRRLLGVVPDAPGSSSGSSSTIISGSGSGSGSASHAVSSGTSGSLHRSAYPISAADVAILLQTMGADRIITVDMRLPGQGQSEGFFAIPVENVRSTRLAIEHVARLKPKLANTVVVAPNEMCIQLAHDFQRGLARRTGEAIGLAAIIEAGPSRGADRYVHRHTRTEDADKATAKLEIVGDVKGESTCRRRCCCCHCRRHRNIIAGPAQLRRRARRSPRAAASGILLPISFILTRVPPPALHPPTCTHPHVQAATWCWWTT